MRGGRDDAVAGVGSRTDVGLRLPRCSGGAACGGTRPACVPPAIEPTTSPPLRCGNRCGPCSSPARVSRRVAERGTHRKGGLAANAPRAGLAAENGRAADQTWAPAIFAGGPASRRSAPLPAPSSEGPDPIPAARKRDVRRSHAGARARQPLHAAERRPPSWARLTRRQAL